MLGVKNYFRFVHIIIETIIHYFFKKLIKIGQNRYRSIIRYIVSFSFLKMGTTLAIFNAFGTIPVLKEQFIISESGHATLAIQGVAIIIRINIIHPFAMS